MSTAKEIRTTVDFLNARNASFALLHCNSTYPAPFQDINLKWMNALREFHPIIGYSGHERGTSVSIAAVAMGASIIERHFTFDRGWEGQIMLQVSLQVNLQIWLMVLGRWN